MNIPAPSTHFKAALAVIALLSVMAATWVASYDYNQPDHVANTPHPQKDIGKDAIEAAREPATLTPKQPVAAGQKPVATFHAVADGGKPVLAPGVVVQADQPRPPAMSGDDVPLAPAASGPTLAKLNDCERWLQCPATTVDGTLVRNKDGTEDLLLSAGGRRLNATFNPGLVAAVPKVHPWLIGTSYGSGGWGLVAGRQFQALPVTVGVEAWRDPQHGQEARAWGVWRF